jgi:DNA-binding MarR family transcriptional regulator
MHQRTTPPRTGTGAGPTTRTELPSELRSPRAKLVYLYLSTHGDATVGQLQEGLGMKKITLYSILGTLRERGVVERREERFAAA